MKIRLMIFALAATLLANSVHAQPSYLKESVVIGGAFILLGDIFENVGDRGTIAIARAPAPGNQAVYEVRQLAVIARTYGVEWRAKSWFDRVVIKRDSIVIGRNEIESELLKEIRKSGLRGEWQIMLRNRRFALTLPADQPATVADALASMPDDDWNTMCGDVFGCAAEFVDVDTVLERIIETDTVSSFQPPVEVWIDGDGDHTVLVHDTKGGE